MAGFDRPHRDIHGLAVRSQELIAQGRREEAKQIIHDAENGMLARLVTLFDGAGAQIRQFVYEYAIVIERSGRKIAIAIDTLKYFGPFDEIVHDLPLLIKLEAKHFVEAIGRKKEGNGTEDVLILDISPLIQDAENS
jgi:hypothetical protein